MSLSPRTEALLPGPKLVGRALSARQIIEELLVARGLVLLFGVEARFVLAGALRALVGEHLVERLQARLVIAHVGPDLRPRVLLGQKLVARDLLFLDPLLAPRLLGDAQVVRVALLLVDQG